MKQYGKKWIAECYGVGKKDECPEVTIDFPVWAHLTLARPIRGRE